MFFIDFRSVQEEEKAFALGVQFVMLRLFGKQALVIFVVDVVVVVVVVIVVAVVMVIRP